MGVALESAEIDARIEWPLTVGCSRLLPLELTHLFNSGEAMSSNEKVRTIVLLEPRTVEGEGEGDCEICIVQHSFWDNSVADVEADMLSLVEKSLSVLTGVGWSDLVKSSPSSGLVSVIVVNDLVTGQPVRFSAIL